MRLAKVTSSRHFGANNIIRYAVAEGFMVGSFELCTPTLTQRAMLVSDLDDGTVVIVMENIRSRD